MKEVGEIKKVIVPDVVGLSLYEACNKLIECGLLYEIGGEGSMIISQFVQAGTEVNSGQVIQINT